ncbi:hypothetical protein JW968_06115 [Candidatus Woesearchaeota archaeon]|nr:hypothetical protein [Candidatus Woesearchaeota archaeon]
MPKHYIIKSHRSHKWLLNLTLLFLIVGAIVIAMTYNQGLLDFISDDPQLLTNALLFILNVNIIILALVLSFFFIELKDAFIQEEEEVIREEKELLRKIGKSKK